ncbi:MAG: tRNA-queuosine alpha-mannosyltransferase domain-containing protein [Myxococcota bacterium]
MTRGLLLSAYDAGSHRRWRRGLERRLDDVDWTVLTLPPRHFRWRIRGNSLSWAFSKRDILEQDFEIVVATSMTDLSALVGFVPALARATLVAYFHENQFAYPRSAHQRDDVNPEVLNLYTALAADRVAFNSAYNLATFLEGTDEVLDMMPDEVPPGIASRVAERARVLPVPLEDELFGVDRPVRAGPMRIVWNHRWEYDKAPERFFNALRMLTDRGIEFRVDVLGKQFRNQPACFQQAKLDLDDSIDQWGFVDSLADYRTRLARADVVVSSALHDFQGLATLEAVALGCHPIVPDRLAYRELFPDSSRYASFPKDAARESAALAASLSDFAAHLNTRRAERAPSVEDLSWSALEDDYRTLLLDDA